MKKSRVRMHIDESDWDVFMHHSGANLDHFGVPSRERTEILDFFESLKQEIVER